MTRSIVSVPVLSVQSTSIAPKFWIAFSRLTITRLRDIASAPFERQTVTIIGNISGVNPTATTRANMSASSQTCFVSPLMRNTSGTITNMMPIISQVKRRTPRSKLLGGWRPVMLRAMPPKYVLRPVVTTAAAAVPLSTFVPMKQTLLSSSGATPARVSGASNFSTGNDSPVRLAWLMNRSFAESTRTSAGIMSPAAKTTTSPGTICSRGISRCRPSRTTVAVMLIIALSFAAAASARDSCQNRKSTLKTTIALIMIAPLWSALLSARL